MQKTKENRISLKLTDGVLEAVTCAGMSRKFAFPAAAVSFDGIRTEAATQTGPVRQLPDGTLTAEYADGPCRFKVTVTPGGPELFFKQVEISADSILPTPDYVEVDFQKQKVSGMECRGYMCTVSEAGEKQSDEEGGGVVPGCGYPLIGDDIFTAIEHPAAYNSIVSEDNGTVHWRLRHFPVWKNGIISSFRAVTGISSTPLKLLWDYIDSMRLPVLKKPLVAFCSFWSDPHHGGHEYEVSRENYASLLKAFNKLDLHPEIYTLDAGWQDRDSFLLAKKSYGGEQALMEIGESFRASGADLSLWVSPNGPVGISNEFLRRSGVAVGKGASCHYQYGEYGVLLDKKLEDELTRRACELASEKYKTVHFKVDWDNECAVSPEFKEKYPTRNHVREASIDMMARINKTIRAINPEIKTRNGRWPSPWHLALSTHVSLPSGGDCEFADLPSLSQRDSAATHRDFVYWCVFVRDKSVFPLDVLDNHEFGHSIRNPFQETCGSWSNSCVWAVMRGSSYHQFTLMPESLENWQADILRHTLAMLRKDPEKFITGHSRMIGGNPAAGSVYGFVHPGKDGSCILALRNSSPIPQEYELPEEAAFYLQTYPDCRQFRAGEKVVFAPHEVKVLNGRMFEEKAFPESPCQLISSGDGSCRCFLPASRRPDVLKIHQLPELSEIYYNTGEIDGRLALTFGIRSPWRMRELKVFAKISKLSCTEEKVHLLTSRLSDCRESSYSIAFPEIPRGIPGSGERRNPTSVPESLPRYFAAEIPQGGEVYFCLVVDDDTVQPEDIELWVSGYESPARQSEETVVPEPAGAVLPLPYPLGFPRNLRLL